MLLYITLPYYPTLPYITNVTLRYLTLPYITLQYSLILTLPYITIIHVLYNMMLAACLLMQYINYSPCLEGLVVSLSSCHSLSC